MNDASSVNSVKSAPDKAQPTVDSYGVAASSIIVTKQVVNRSDFAIHIVIRQGTNHRRICLLCLRIRPSPSTFVLMRAVYLVGV